MCGIVAYRREQPALPALVVGLSRLEYRGYDPAGFALTTPGGDMPLRVHRSAGALAVVVLGPRSTWRAEAGELKHSLIALVEAGAPRGRSYRRAQPRDWKSTWPR